MKQIAFVLGVTATIALPALAAEPASPIDPTLRNLEKLIESGVSAEALTKQMYTEDPIVTGYGVAKPRVGVAAETVAIDGFLKSLAPAGKRNCKFTLVSPTTLSPTVIASFTNLACRGKDDKSAEADQKYHVLYVWKKVGDTWRVSLEMFASNFLDSK